MAGILRITDGTTTIDLKTGAFRLVDWTPATPPTKGGGVWQDSMLDDGRRLTMTKRNNAREVFQLRVVTQAMDDTILETQELRRLLEKAREYWTTNWQREPVWIEARGACETNTRYAYVMDYSAERDDNPYIDPFNSDILSTMDEWSLEIERSDWLNNIPGVGSCVAVANTQSYYTGTAADTAAPTESGDDAYVEFYAGTLILAQTYIRLGHILPAVYGGGIRFRGVAIPAGATVISARIDVVSNFNDAGTTIASSIYGELNAAPALFTTFANFSARALTTNRYDFSTSETWVAGTTYTIAQGAPLIALIQEIVNLGGWAAGNNLAVLIFDSTVAEIGNGRREIATWDNVAYAEPTLYVEWSTGLASRGRAATCNNEVYFANKHNTSQITHAYHNRAAAWVDIMAAALPAPLFPAAPAVGDIFYAGVDSTLANSGPFSSVIFDIGTAANDIIAIDWEYWNGGWVALTTVRTIDTLVPVEYFNVAGVGSVSFVQPADWATTAVNGVTGYWIRCVIAAVGAAPTPPTQANRLIYTVVRPSVDVDELQVIGDVTALARMKVHDYTSAYHSPSVILAIRSQDRGSNFRMYLNASDEQNPSNMSFVYPAPGNVTMAVNTSSPTGRCGYYNPGAGSVGYCYWNIFPPTSKEYFGRYRAYLRVDRNSAVTDCTVKLSVGIQDPFSLYEAYTYESEVKTVLSGQPNYLIDFGTIDVPGFGALRSTDDMMALTLRLDFANTTANPALYIYDLILIPVDEWAGEFAALNPEEEAERIGFMYSFGTMRVEIYLDVDSLNLKKRLSAYTRNPIVGDLLQYSWKDITAAAAQLQANKDQQVFAMLKTYYATDDVWLLPVEGLGTLDIDAAARYLSFRGDR